MRFCNYLTCKENYENEKKIVIRICDDFVVGNIKGRFCRKGCSHTPRYKNCVIKPSQNKQMPPNIGLNRNVWGQSGVVLVSAPLIFNLNRWVFQCQGSCLISQSSRLRAVPEPNHMTALHQRI